MADEKKTLPAVTSSEIQEWEQKFIQNVTPLVKFDLQDGKHSMRLYNGESGIEATWSGIILLKADNYIKWSYSIQNEAFVDAKFTLDDSNYNLIEKIYKFYEDWRNQWSKMINTEKPNLSSGQPEITNPQAPGTLATGQLPIPSSQGTGGLAEVKRTTVEIINEHSDRMRKLAGITTNTTIKKEIPVFKLKR